MARPVDTRHNVTRRASLGSGCNKDPVSRMPFLASRTQVQADQAR